MLFIFSYNSSVFFDMKGFAMNGGYDFLEKKYIK